MAPGVTISSSVDIASHVDVKRNVSVEAKEIVQLENLQYDNTLLLHHTSVTDDFDSLRFEAAAATQLVDTTKQDVSSQQLSHHLVSSPYNDSAHLLDLRRLTPQSLLFAKALTHLKPTRPDYATANYVDSLNFDEVLASLRNLIKVEQTHGDRTFQWKRWSFYVVVFRSVLKPDIDNDRLYLLDAKSHQEATESGGLLKYWFGKCSDERKNLATCFWHSREDAHLGGLGPWHAKARQAGRVMYERIVFSTHRFTVLDDAEGWEFEDWKE